MNTNHNIPSHLSQPKRAPSDVTFMRPVYTVIEDLKVACANNPVALALVKELYTSIGIP